MTSWDFGDGASSPRADWGDTASATRGSSGGFHDSVVPPHDGGGGSNVSAPTLWLVAGIVVAVAAVVLNLVTSSWSLATVAWTLGGPVAIGMLGVFTQRDTARRADPWYADSGFTPWGRRLLVVISLVAVALSAWTIADFVARGGS